MGHSFQSAKARLKVMEEEMRALQWEHEVLEQRFEKVSSICELIIWNFICFKRLFSELKRAPFKKLYFLLTGATRT